MSEKPLIIDLESSRCARHQKELKEITLKSGRRISAKSAKDHDILEIRESDGQMIIKMRLTDKGPEMIVKGARLELKSSESIALKTKKLEIDAEESAAINSRGTLDMNSSQEIKINSDNDLRLTGKLIHIN